KVRALAGVATDTLRLEVKQGGETIRPLSLSPVGSGEAARFVARVGPLPAGDYELRLVETGASDSLSLPLHVTAGFEAELADVSADESLLARLAEASGGENVPLERLGGLAERIRERAARRSRFVEQRLWDSPYLFALVVACFAA